MQESHQTGVLPCKGHCDKPLFKQIQEYLSDFQKLTFSFAKIFISSQKFPRETLRGKIEILLSRKVLLLLQPEKFSQAAVNARKAHESETEETSSNEHY